jgi:predicted anti-sigma-YlaC factor YlaD
MENDSLTVILQFVTGTIIPFAVLYLQRVSWKPYYKFGLAAALSIIVATLMAVIDNEVTPQATLTNFTTILTISQTVYHTFFRTLNLHAGLFPQDALVNKSKDSVASSIEAMVDPVLAQQIIDERKPEQLSISVDITKADG